MFLFPGTLTLYYFEYLILDETKGAVAQIKLFSEQFNLSAEIANHFFTLQMSKSLSSLSADQVEIVVLLLVYKNVSKVCIYYYELQKYQLAYQICTKVVFFFNIFFNVVFLNSNKKAILPQVLLWTNMYISFYKYIST